MAQARGAVKGRGVRPKIPDASRISLGSRVCAAGQLRRIPLHLEDAMENSKEVYAGVALTDLMKDHLLKDECAVTGGVKNKLGDKIKKMTSLEFYC